MNVLYNNQQIDKLKDFDSPCSVGIDPPRYPTHLLPTANACIMTPSANSFRRTLTHSMLLCPPRRQAKRAKTADIFSAGRSGRFGRSGRQFSPPSLSFVCLSAGIKFRFARLPIIVDRPRGLPSMTSDVHRIRGFFDPLPLSLSSQFILFVRKFVIFLTNTLTSPFYADVMYGSPQCIVHSRGGRGQRGSAYNKFWRQRSVRIGGRSTTSRTFVGVRRGCAYASPQTN